MRLPSIFLEADLPSVSASARDPLAELFGTRGTMQVPTGDPMPPDLFLDVDAFLAAAAAAGVVGNAAYDAVARLVAWTASHAGGREAREALTSDDMTVLAELFGSAQAEWQPESVTQTVVVGGSQQGVVINANRSSVET
jgi:hypothetical protein